MNKSARSGKSYKSSSSTEDFPAHLAALARISCDEIYPPQVPMRETRSISAAIAASALVTEVFAEAQETQPEIIGAAEDPIQQEYSQVPYFPPCDRR